MTDSGLTKRQLTWLRKRQAENAEVTRARYGKRKYDKLAKAVRAVIESTFVKP